MVGFELVWVVVNGFITVMVTIWTPPVIIQILFLQVLTSSHPLFPHYHHWVGKFSSYYHAVSIMFSLTHSILQCYTQLMDLSVRVRNYQHNLIVTLPGMAMLTFALLLCPRGIRSRHCICMGGVSLPNSSNRLLWRIPLPSFHLLIKQSLNVAGFCTSIHFIRRGCRSAIGHILGTLEGRDRMDEMSTWPIPPCWSLLWAFRSTPRLERPVCW